jgi:hypothetical protein
MTLDGRMLGVTPPGAFLIVPLGWYSMHPDTETCNVRQATCTGNSRNNKLDGRARRRGVIATSSHAGLRREHMQNPVIELHKTRGRHARHRHGYRRSVRRHRRPAQRSSSQTIGCMTPSEKLSELVATADSRGIPIRGPSPLQLSATSASRTRAYKATSVRGTPAG